jgi:hypothetical protein
VRDMMVSDLRGRLDLETVQQAADLLIALRQFLSAYPEARIGRYSLKRKGLSASHRFCADSNNSAVTVSLHLVEFGTPIAAAESGR